MENETSQLNDCGVFIMYSGHGILLSIRNTLKYVMWMLYNKVEMIYVEGDDI
jgi:hypothetical protein